MVYRQFVLFYVLVKACGMQAKSHCLPSQDLAVLLSGFQHCEAKPTEIFIIYGYMPVALK